MDLLIINLLECVRIGVIQINALKVFLYFYKRKRCSRDYEKENKN